MSRRRYHARPVQPARGRARWTREHAGKEYHTTYDDALPYMAGLSYAQFMIYECRWGDSYEFGEAEPLHWHVGRRKGQPQRGS